MHASDQIKELVIMKMHKLHVRAPHSRDITNVYSYVYIDVHSDVA